MKVAEPVEATGPFDGLRVLAVSFSLFRVYIRPVVTK